MATPYHKNVPGPFYVEDGCCTTCSIPTEVAPEIFAYDDEAGASHCFVHCQPNTAEAIAKVLNVIHQAEFDCIRYRGSDPAIIRKLVEQGSEDQRDAEP